MRTWLSLSFSLVNTIVRPSGDQAGSASEQQSRGWVSSRWWRPSAAMTPIAGSPGDECDPLAVGRPGRGADDVPRQPADMRAADVDNVDEARPVHRIAVAEHWAAMDPREGDLPPVRRPGGLAVRDWGDVA